jgi:glycosyltransferase involved in cell wall biosynthesis
MVYARAIATCSIIIPAYNEEKYISPCLESIRKVRTPGIIEIIVVDNASTDRTPEVACAHEGVTVVREEQKGTSSARQRGFREAKGDLLVFIDADSQLPDGWIARASAWLADEDTVCVSGPYLCYDASWIWNMLSLAYWWIFAMPASFFTRTVAVGGGMMIRRSALEAAGGFDTSITFYGDDTSIAKRLSQVGTVHFDPRLIIYSSARRFKNHGFIRVGWTYACNFVSQAFVSKSITKHHEDVR